MRCSEKGLPCEGSAAIGPVLINDQLEQDSATTAPVPNQFNVTGDLYADLGPMDDMEPPQQPMLEQHIPTLMTPTSPIHNTMVQPGFDMSFDPAFNDMDANMGIFLKDVMNPIPSTNFDVGDVMLPDVLDFTFDDFMEFPLSVFDRSNQMQSIQATPLHPSYRENGLLREQNRSHHASGTLTPNVKKAADLGLQAFKDSMWLWTPSKDDHHTADQVFLTLPSHAITEARSPDVPFPCQLSLATRDRLLASILRLCEADVQRRVVARFPTAELLSALVENFVGFHKKQILAWIHLPTLDIEELRDELLLSIIASGAAHARHPDIRRLGFAMQETARTAIAQMFEEDNRNTRDLRCMQTNGLHLHVGLWSGIRRKIEIAESFMLPFVTMLRRGARFRNKNGPPTEISNDPTANEVRWKQWVEVESMKRLAFHALYEDTCISMSLLNPPLISPLEFVLDLPCARNLWEAINADEWRQNMLIAQANSQSSVPTLRACLGDIGVLINNQAFVDVQMSFLLVVCSVWSRVWQWRQMKAVSAIAGSTAHSLPVTSYQSELTNLCKQLALSDTDVVGGIEPYPKLFLEICQLHLHVSLEDIQTFAGKEGHEEARKMVTSLRTWTKQPDARCAIYHAGQILKQASRFPFGFLTGFSAIAVYHAGLVLWAYAVLTEPNSLLTPRNEESPSSLNLELVRLDGAQQPGEFQRFFMLGKGSPCICAYKVNESHDDGSITFLTDPLGVMESITNLLANKNGIDYEMPPIVSNLIKLMHSLGKAASVLKRDKS